MVKLHIFNIILNNTSYTEGGGSLPGSEAKLPEFGAELLVSGVKQTLLVVVQPGSHGEGVLQQRPVPQLPSLDECRDQTKKTKDIHSGKKHRKS